MRSTAMAQMVRRIAAGGATESRRVAGSSAPDDPGRRRARLWDWAMGQDPLRAMSADERQQMARYLLPYIPLRWELRCELYLEYTKGDIRHEAIYQTFVRPDG